MPTPSFPFLTDHRPIQQGRYEKVAALRAAGINPYPARFEPTHLATDVLAAESDLLDREDKPVALMGRALTIRKFGKAAFFHLLDRSGQIQVYINAKAIDEAGFALYKEYLDAGDIVGVTGHLFRTKTGELTIQAKTLQLLTKSTRPLPEKWHGLTDKELRYRRRYVDLIVNPDVMATMRTRSRVLASMRRWLDDQGFLEVETPMLQPLYGGASARPFTTHHNALDMDLYLRIAPELYLKRLCVGGMHRVYEINRNFRNEGISVRHNPEFTMLELYAGGWNATRLMEFVEDLLINSVQLATGSATIKTKAGDCDIARRPWPRITILEALEKFAGLRLDWTMTRDQVKAALDGRHFLPEAANSGIDAIVFLFEELCEHHLVEPTFITQFPKAISPLAKSMDGNPDVTDRFELYANGMEIANGFSELNDPAEQFARFSEQVERRKGGDMEAVGVIDEDYVRALEYGMPPSAGLGVGIDRLVMLATGAESIRDVILFPLMRAVSAEADASAEAESASAPEAPSA